MPSSCLSLSTFAFNSWRRSSFAGPGSLRFPNIESNILSTSRKGSRSKNEFRNCSFSAMMRLAHFLHKCRCIVFPFRVSVYEM